MIHMEMIYIRWVESNMRSKINPISLEFSKDVIIVIKIIKD